MADLKDDNKKSYKLTLLKYLFVYLPVYIVLDIFFPPVTYIFHYCLIGLIIGFAVSCGLNENEAIGKKKLFGFILLCSLSALMKCIVISTRSIAKHIFSLLIPIAVLYYPINLIFLCPLCLGIYGFIFYRKNKYVNLFFLGVGFVGFLIIHVINIVDIISQLPECFLPEEYNMLLGFRLVIAYILFFCFFSLLIMEFISYIIKKKGLPDKKKLFIWIILCSFIIHMSLGVVYYILDSNCNEYEHGYLTFLYDHLRSSESAKIGRTPIELRSWVDYFPLIYKIYIRFLGFYSYITFHKIDANILIGIQIYIIEFLVTVLCAWRFVLYACPAIPNRHMKDDKQ